MRRVVYFIFFLLLIVTETLQAQSQINIISLEHGAKMLQTPASQVDLTERNLMAKHSAGAMFDQSAKVWSSRDTNFPLTFVSELAEEYAIQKLVFNNKTEFYPGIETKKVRVEFSTEGPGSGYRSGKEFELSKGSVNEFQLDNIPARWIRLVVLENYGNSERVQLAEFEAWGVPDQKIGKTVDINGLWHTNWQDITFEQNGNAFEGKYVYTTGSRKFKGKVQNGRISRNKINFEWDEGSIEGTAELYLNREGTQISGLWRNAKNPNDFNLWTMSRTKEESKEIEYSGPAEVIAKKPESEPESAPAPLPEVKLVAPVKIAGIEVEAGKNIVLKNVFFAVGKSVVTAASYPELNQLYDYLDANPDARVKITGHTDKIGDAKKNLILSQQRADAIKDYLTKKGLEDKRIETEGKGDTETICSPPCRENRRVEFVLL